MDERHPLLDADPSQTHAVQVQVAGPPASLENDMIADDERRNSGDERLPVDRGTFGRTHLRFTVLFAAIIVAFATMPLWLLIATPTYSQPICAAISVAMGFEWIAIALNAIFNYRRLHRVPVPHWRDAVRLRTRRFKHIVVVPCYLDPLDVLQKCLRSLAVSARACDLVVVVTFEAKAPDLDAKMRAVREEFGSPFGDFLVVVHRLDSRSEIPGGCSNKNFALREAFTYCSDRYGRLLHDGCERDADAARFTITTCDTDSLFHPSYFEALEAAYNAENPQEHDSPCPRHCVWQPPLFYNWQLDGRPFFNRVTCLMRSMMMLGGLISFNLNPMSVFSYPLEMGYAAGFINPRYGVDDIIAKVRWMCDTNSAVPVKLLGVPVISGPTIGQTVGEEALEWGRQCRRWIVGSSEAFHYFLIHFRCRPAFSGLLWFATFFSYYGVLLCCAALFNVLASVPFPQATQYSIEFGPGVAFPLRYATAVSLGLQLAAFAVAFIIDALATRSLGVDEHIHPLRNVAHWISAPAVLLTYSLISFLSIVRFVAQGKKFAGHDMAAKEGFSVSTPTTQSSTHLAPSAPLSSSSSSSSPFFSTARWQN